MSASTSASEDAPPTACLAACRGVLRQDLRLYPGPRVGGAPSWMLYDCVRHAYFQLDPNAFAVLSAWDGPADAASLAARLEHDGPLLPDGTVDAFFDFAERNELVEAADGAWQGHARKKRAGRSSPLMWLVHNYLFIKIPLWRPRRAFERAGFPRGAALHPRLSP